MEDSTGKVKAITIIGRRTRSGATSAAHAILPSDPLPARRNKNNISMKNNNAVRQLTTVADNTPVSNALPVPTTGSVDNPPAHVDQQALMSEEDYLLAKKERKAFFDAQRCKKMKDAKGTVSDSVSHFTVLDTVFDSGWQTKGKE